jgi:hypothetical protein
MALDKDALLSGPLESKRHVNSSRSHSIRYHNDRRRSRSHSRSPVCRPQDEGSTNCRGNENQNPRHKKVEPYRGDGKRDPSLPSVDDDPRLGTVLPCAVKAAKGNTGRNTESFDPTSTLVRPAMRVVVGSKNPVFGKSLKHDDVVVVPEFFCAQDDWTMYYRLIEEMRSLQSTKQKKSEWIPWAEGCHLISQNPTGCPSYEDVLRRMAAYFNMTPHGTRFNWYRDSSDWKPFHHDSAAYNPHRAKTQNLTVGVSFGAERELAFLHADTHTRVYFPQSNGMLFAFGRDVNIHWKHGVNALHPSIFCGKGRISIILWGLALDVIEEPNSPGLLTNDARHGYDNTSTTKKRKDVDNNRVICRDFERDGHCPYEDKCRFDHRPPSTVQRFKTHSVYSRR